MQASRVEEAVDQADELNIFPAVATRVMRLAESPTASLIDLEKAVSTDASLSAQVLKVANSGFFGLSRQVGSVREALLILGFDNTRDLAVALSVGSLGRSARRGRRELWVHSLRAAVLAQRVAELSDAEKPRELFVVGLLHDLGKLVMLELAEDRYAHMAGESHGAPLAAAERQGFGFDHAMLGAACLDRWTLPESFARAVREHHAVPVPAGAVPADLREATWLHLADDLAHLAPSLRGDAAAALARLRDDAEVGPWIDGLGLRQACPELAEHVAQIDATIAALQLT